jgi:hypothetical protein
MGNDEYPFGVAIQSVESRTKKSDIWSEGKPSNALKPLVVATEEDGVLYLIKMNP